MKEEFLHFLWEGRHIRGQDLRTTDNERLRIVDWGFYNLHDGPDFMNARIYIGDTLWAGNVEMHVSASDWQRHGHSGDPRYENVILHVVLEDDIVIKRSDGSKIPCLELKKHIPPELVGRYLKLISVSSWVPCANHIRSIPRITKLKVLESRLVERLEEKIKTIRNLAKETRYDWESVLYSSLAGSFGFKTNTGAMQTLARRVPLKLIRKHLGNHMEIEALFFGCAGMLNRVFIDDYPGQLQAAFNHLSGKYRLKPMTETVWRWKRSRPANFPSVRISQFANLMHANAYVLSAYLQATEIRTLRKFFTCAASEYFDTHYSFDRPSNRRKKTLGQASVDRILINTLLPFLFCYATERNLPPVKERVLAFYEQIHPENNSITRRWVALGMPHDHAGHSQALIQLKNTHCDKHHCLRCAIGNAILAPSERTGN